VRALQRSAEDEERVALQRRSSDAPVLMAKLPAQLNGPNLI